MRRSAAPLAILAAAMLVLPPSGQRPASAAAVAATVAAPTCNVADSRFYRAYASTQGDLVFACVAGTLLGDGPYVVLDAASKDCVSCHGQTLYVFRGHRLILVIPADDPSVTPILGGFRVLQPVRVSSEALCCPSHAYVLDYLWNGATFVPRRRGTVKVP